MGDFLTKPSSQFVNVTKSDTALLAYQGVNSGCRGILLGVAGDLAIKDDAGTSVTISGLAAGIIHPIATNQILSTGTTASDFCVFF